MWMEPQTVRVLESESSMKGSIIEQSYTLGFSATNNEWITTYLKIVLNLKSKFSRCDFKQVSQSENNHTDSLVNLASAVKY